MGGAKATGGRFLLRFRQPLHLSRPAARGSVAMMRKFTFEAEIYDSLNCLPMAARRKLDALGIKLHLAQWEQLGRGERLMICHAPTDSDDERSALRAFIEEAVLARTGSPTKA